MKLKELILELQKLEKDFGNTPVTFRGEESGADEDIVTIKLSSRVVCNSSWETRTIKSAVVRLDSM